MTLHEIMSHSTVESNAIFERERRLLGIRVVPMSASQRRSKSMRKVVIRVFRSRMAYRRTEVAIPDGILSEDHRGIAVQAVLASRQMNWSSSMISMGLPSVARARALRCLLLRSDSSTLRRSVDPTTT